MNKTDSFTSLKDALSLKGKTTLITGAAAGIGRAISKRFAEAGSDLLITDIDIKGLNALKKTLKNFPIKVRTEILDIEQKNDIDGFWKNLGTSAPDILINNAGIYPAKKYLDVDRDFYEKILNINLSSVFWMCQNFIRYRAKSGGTIVNIASIEAIIPFKEEMTHYSMSKSGVCTLTRSLAHDFGKSGFRVNGVIPAVVKTPGIYNVAKAAIKQMRLDLVKTGYNYKSRLALGRIGDADEIAKVILFLCSDLASYVQGAMIPVDGGFLSS